jgi:hypothetical protein
MDERLSGVVFVGENFDLDDAFRLTGLFSAHWEDPGGDAYLQGPAEVPVAEAIAWGRERAPVVLVRLGDDDEHYSAGEKQPDETIRIWPPDGLIVRARPFGSALDGSEQVVTYALASTIRGDALPLERVRAALENDPQVGDVGVEPASKGSVEVRYEVRAARSIEALARGEEKLERVLEELAAVTGGASLESTAVIETR